jgi:hypothetical protein
MFHRYLLQIPSTLQSGDVVTFFLPRFPKAYERVVQEVITHANGSLKQLVFTAGDAMNFSPGMSGKLIAEYHSANRAFSSDVQIFKLHTSLAVAS